MKYLMKYLTLKLKITLLFSLLILSLLIGGYFYLTKMSTVSGNININKTNPIDKLCNYIVYSDFYYRVVEYSNETENNYGELTPVRTTICYDFKKNVINLQSRIEDESSIILDDTHGNSIAKKIHLLDNFKKTYSQIIATQDKDYFDKSAKIAQQTLLSLYGQNTFPIKEVNPHEEYYTKIDNLPIENLSVEHFKLQQITSPAIQATNESGWQPNILQWNFEEKDRIYFQYLKKVANTDLDAYIKSIYNKSNKVIVKLTKFNNNTLNKMFLIFDDTQNKVKTLFMDNNGHIYILILQVSNQKAFETYFNDYMKIAYGIFFTKQETLKSVFSKEQKKAEKTYEEYKTYYQEMREAYDTLSEYKGINLLNNYQETKSTNDFMALDKVVKMIGNNIFDKKYETFKEIHGTYPNEKILNSLLEDIKNIKLITEAIEELRPVVSIDRNQKGAKRLKEKCPENLECIKKLKDNNWEDQ